MKNRIHKTDGGSYSPEASSSDSIDIATKMA